MEELLNVDHAKIESNKKTFAELFKGNKKAVVLVDWKLDTEISHERALESKEDQYGFLISWYNKGCEAVMEGFDNVPVVSVFADVAYLMALAYGCRMIINNGIIIAEPMYKCPEEALNFRKRDRIYEYGLYPVICERIFEFQRRWSCIPITISDNQSPIDVVTSIFHSEGAMLAMYDNPSLVHYMLEIVTDSITEVNRHLESIINNFAGFYSGQYMPFGMLVSDDAAAYISPGFYKEFAIPYVERLSSEFGGINFHCCMGHAHNLENYVSVKGFLGFDASPDYNDYNTIIRTIKNKGVWTVSNHPSTKKSDRYETDEETFVRLLKDTNGICGLIIRIFDEDKEQALRLADKVKNWALKLGRI